MCLNGAIDYIFVFITCFICVCIFLGQSMTGTIPMYTSARQRVFPLKPYAVLRTQITDALRLSGNSRRQIEICQRLSPSNRQLLNRGFPLGFRFSGCTTAPLIPLWWVMVHVVSHHPVKPLFTPFKRCLWGRCASPALQVMPWGYFRFSRCALFV